ncbi:MAG TPA: hypothetical protein VHR65_09315 [Solirubrobacterales bacterium]|jgi:hypothetical protein|nr:hypothetical protein [Solirubrobacterales bacterium]
MKGRIASVALLAIALAAAASACLASAAEAPTRQEYVTRLEAICRPDVVATEQAMKGVRDDIRAERDSLASGKFARGAEIFGGTIGEITGVSRPPADSARLHKWFVYLKRQESYLQQITSRLRAGQTIRAQRATARFIHNGNLANNVVLAFGFNYCSFRFSRFG